MKIMTFNTQHCEYFVTHKIDFPRMSRTITDLGADIVGLNEIRGSGLWGGYTNQTEALSRGTCIPYSYFAKAIDVGGVPNPYGNALLSKIPIISAETIPVPDPKTRSGSHHYETRCLLKAVLEGGITVLVIHFGLNPEESALAVETVLPHLTDSRCILMGDFNVTPDDPVLLPIRQRMRDTAELFPCPKLSFPSDKPTMKIDYIFVSSDVKMLSADIPEIVASDHRPHVAEVELK